MANESWRRENRVYDQVITLFNWMNPQVMKLADEFIEFAEKDTRDNFVRLGINRSSTRGHGFTGNLWRRANSVGRRLMWRTWNASGGDVQVFEAVFEHYAKFVELAVQRHMPYIEIPAISERKWKPIERPDKKPRKAKPFFTTEMRKQGKKLETKLLRYYAYTGSMYVAYSVAPTPQNGLSPSAADSLNTTIMVPPPEEFK